MIHTPSPWVSDSACGLYARNVTSAGGAIHVATVLMASPATATGSRWDEVQPLPNGAGNLALVLAAPGLASEVERLRQLVLRVAEEPNIDIARALADRGLS